MSITIKDGFEGYFTEKIWAMIPDVYRFQDGLASNPGVLRALVQILAKEAVFLRRSQDRLWEDIFIETCDEWAVPYIGGLVATRLLSALNPRGRRVDVAKTIYYRRRKGTPSVLEELINDISGWDGKMVESFKKLGRSRHGLDPQPGSLLGLLTSTPPGGWADLRQQQGSELANGPFDEYFHTPDLRFARGQQGIYNIPKLAFHLYRMVAYPLKNDSTFSLGDGIRFMFDPSGRNIPLFSKSNRPSDWSQWHSALEWELQAPIRCRLLGQAFYQITSEVIAQLSITPLPGLSAAAAKDLGRLVDLVFRDETTLRTQLAALPSHIELLGSQIIVPLLKYSLVHDCGKSRLFPDALALENGGSTSDTGSIAIIQLGAPPTLITAEYCTAANLQNWTASAPDKQVAVDPQLGRFAFLNGARDPATINASYYYGFPGPFGAGTYSRLDASTVAATPPLISGGGALPVIPGNTITEIEDSKTYNSISAITAITSCTLRAADQQRPYLYLQADWTMDTGANTDSNLVLDGLWIGSAGNGQYRLILNGDYTTVTIRNSTLDPGGDTNIKGETLYPLPILIQGKISNLCIENSITGPISLAAGGNAEIENLCISDSIIQSQNSATPAIDLPLTNVQLDCSTVFGKVNADRLRASEVILTDLANITDTQDGCFRFSAAPAASRLPRPYNSFLYTVDTSYWFLSKKFGQPGFASLSEAAPIQVSTGGENGTEMGVFHSLMNPIKLKGLWTKIQEYMPFGLIPLFINET